jgi:transposase
MATEQAKAWQRAQVIVKVRGGLLPATEGAQQLGTSRKTYYQWERRGLEGMVAALTERPKGRPAAAPDPEKEALKEQVERLEKEKRILEQRLQIREQLDRLKSDPQASRSEKKTNSTSRW